MVKISGNTTLLQQVNYVSLNLIVMQTTSAMDEDGRTKLSKSKEISSYRMANHRNRLALYEEYKFEEYKSLKHAYF